MRPIDDKGRYVPLKCPCANCGAGSLQFEGGGGVWRCDGLASPDHEDQPLYDCEFTHIDGTPYNWANEKSEQT